MGLVLGLAWLTTAGCASSSGAAGDPSDATVRSGSYLGYSVTRPCGWRGSDDDSSIGVRGTGKVLLSDLAAFVDSFVKPSLVGRRGVESVAVGETSCGPLNIAVYLTDWKVVDDLVVDLGAIFVEHNVDVGAGLTLGPASQPL